MQLPSASDMHDYMQVWPELLLQCAPCQPAPEFQIHPPNMAEANNCEHDAEKLLNAATQEYHMENDHEGGKALINGGFFIVGALA